MKEKIQQLYTVIADDLNQYLQENSIYKPNVYQDEPEEKEFPIVIIKELPRINIYGNLSYGEETYDYGLETSVNTIQQDGVSKQSIANEITNLIEKFFTEKYRMINKISKNLANLDTDVYRDIIQSTCIIDTKYHDKLVIYPK